MQEKDSLFTAKKFIIPFLDVRGGPDLFSFRRGQNRLTRALSVRAPLHRSDVSLAHYFAPLAQSCDIYIQAASPAPFDITRLVYATGGDRIPSEVLRASANRKRSSVLGLLWSPLLAGVLAAEPLPERLEGQSHRAPSAIPVVPSLALLWFLSLGFAPRGGCYVLSLQ